MLKIGINPERKAFNVERPISRAEEHAANAAAGSRKSAGVDVYMQRSADEFAKVLSKPSKKDGKYAEVQQKRIEELGRKLDELV